MNSGLSESDSEFPVTKVKCSGWERALVQGWWWGRAPGRVRGNSGQAGLRCLTVVWLVPQSWESVLATAVGETGKT